ncbi:hypothetical protein CcrBL47_gp447 [Caulobacter phage BL47]|nr:hypothetical protein CcrBL47_gp447 [Caulobacter phage BL47]
MLTQFDFETQGLGWPTTPRKTLTMNVVGADKTLRTLQLAGKGLEKFQSFVKLIKLEKERSRRQFEARRSRAYVSRGHRDIGARGPLRRVARLTRQAHQLRRRFQARA